ATRARMRARAARPASSPGPAQRCNGSGEAPPPELQLRTRREARLAHEVGVDAARRLAAFPDRPDDERLTAPHVAAREHAGHARLVVRSDGDVAALVELHAELVDHPRLLRSEEPHGEQHEVAIELAVAAGNLDHLHAAVVGLLPLETDAVELLHVAVGV